MLGRQDFNRLEAVLLAIATFVFASAVVGAGTLASSMNEMMRSQTIDRLNQASKLMTKSVSNLLLEGSLRQAWLQLDSASQDLGLDCVRVLDANSHDLLHDYSTDRCTREFKTTCDEVALVETS